MSKALGTDIDGDVFREIQLRGDYIAIVGETVTLDGRFNATELDAIARKLEESRLESIRHNEGLKP